MNSRIYISGKIAGLEPEEYEPMFYEAEAKLKAEGYEVVNPLRIYTDPAEIDPKTHTEEEIWRAHLKTDIKELMGCEAVYMLPNWERSEGATLEHNIARGLRLTVRYEVEPRHREIKETIEAVMGIPFRLIATGSRNRPYVYARMIYAHHSRKEGDTATQIGKDTCHDESTVCYYLRHYDIEYKFNREFRKVAEKVATVLSKKLSTPELAMEQDV